ncbi:hypothetical protein BGZ80_000731 [Entomortierella chlamydospora]|uniref:CHY-type domain-containing protein n=1 Tax=Entomortierella chlamydospora TaxID=101097 RepID=A0A9P6MS08_9FUNG|nr:hypothetical protein BGZ79_008273 [Entomortierella chlamydospora]KAG0011381.1 hypothetical protein BGZ80_000731 [Entomortierella chlamydospora]
MTSHCQFYLSKKGCRNGANCRFIHSDLPATATSPAPTTTTTTTTTTTNTAAARRAPVSKPIPKSLQNIDQNNAASSLRAFEISQLSSRFKSSFQVKRSSINDNTNPLDNDYSNHSVFELKIHPSDPDFPYEIETLHIQLTVPQDYPHSPCSVLVLNSNIPKGFSTNLERGFAQAAHQKKSLLAHLNWLDVNMEQLLQKPPAPTIRFVTHAQQQPISLPPPQKSTSPTPALTSTTHSKPHLHNSTLSTSPTPPVTVSSQTVFTAEQIDQAALQRQKQLAQIQARFRASFATISPTEFQISLESTDKTGMTVTWQGPLWVNLLIPKSFPLHPCEIRLKQDGRNPEIELWRARNVEQGFRQIVAAMPQLSLFQLLNQLNRDLKDLINMPAPSITTQAKTTPSDQSSASKHDATSAQSLPPLDLPQGIKSTGKLPDSRELVPDRNPKLIYVKAPGPPPRRNFEQLRDNGEVTSEDDDDDQNGDDSATDTDSDVDIEKRHQNLDQISKSGSGTEPESTSDPSEDEDNDQVHSLNSDAPVAESAPKRGVEIRMPDIKLENISLMYCRLLNLLVRCSRCKGLFEIPNLTPEDGQSLKPGTDTRKWRTCENCRSLLGANFRTEYVHMQSRTIGYLDLAGCTAFDILPSVFVPTCSECDQILGTSSEGQSATADPSTLGSESASIPDPSSSSSSAQAQRRTTNHSASVGFRQRVGRGMSSTANCRKCHARMTFSMEGEVKFVKLSPGDLMKANSAALEQLPLKSKLARKNKNGLDFELKVGEPLPRKGACDHYKKSRRWFRFPCCSKIYPCHICHDEKESDSHEFEYAKRMVCGHCSREQNVSDKPCICGERPVKTSGGSGEFWEGGQGMRDKTRMSRKDPKKHRGTNKTVAKKQVGDENMRKRAPKS